MASILVIYNEIPNERLNGGAIRVFYLLKELSRYHSITLLTLPTSRSTKPNGSYLKFCSEVILAPRFFEQFLRLFPLEFFGFIWNNLYYYYQRYFSSRPELVRKHFLQVYFLKRELDNLLRRKSFDFIQVENAYLGDVLSGFEGKIGKVIDFHDVYDWVEILAPIYDIALTCSKEDFCKLKLMGFRKVVLVANGIATKKAKKFTLSSNTNKLLFVGDLMHAPNSKGLHYFLREVYPFLNQFLPFHIIGRYKSSDFKKEMNIPGVLFHGFLPEIDQYFEDAIFICPIFEGSGPHIKILTAFLKGAPVVSSSNGAKGINCINEKEIIIADSAAQFILAVDLLSRNKSRYNSMKKDARKFVEKSYDWRKIVLTYAKSL